MAIEFSFTDEHEELRATLRSFLEKRSDEEAVRAAMASERGWDESVWRQMAEELGLAGLVIDEEHGGAGFGYVELLVAMEEMGRALLCSPFLGTAVLSANALQLAAEETARKELLPGIALGERIVSLAWAEPNGRWDLDGIEMQATGSRSDTKLRGAKAWVLDGHVADELLVVARQDGALALFRVAGDAPGVSRRRIPALDLTRPLARVELDDAPATRISAGDATPALERAIARSVAALTAEQVGGAQKCLEMSVDYAKSRLQFGRPIGSYQSIKHKCADMLVAVEFAKSAAYGACFAAAEDADDFPESAALAKSYCSEAYFRAAADTIQIHGGMGFTWEHPAHLYFKRAKASELLFGDPAYHRERLAGLVGL